MQGLALANRIEEELIAAGHALLDKDHVKMLYRKAVDEYSRLMKALRSDTDPTVLEKAYHAAINSGARILAVGRYL